MPDRSLSRFSPDSDPSPWEPTVSADEQPVRDGDEEPPAHDATELLDAIIEVGDPDHVVLARVLGYYHQTLKDNAEALAYLHKRCLVHAELLDTFKLGFSNRTLGLRLPKVNRRAGFAIRTQLQRLGILRSSGHEHFHGAIVVPVYDTDGRVEQLYGRLTTRSPKPGARLHLYAPEQPRGVFNLQALDARDVIVCKSVIDALTFWCQDFRNVTCSWGLDGFTHEHLVAFQEHAVERVLVAFDRTDAGDKAAQLLAERLADHGMQVFRVVLPQGCDVNDYATSDAGQERGLEVLVRNATWLAGTRSAPVVESVVSPPTVVAEDTAALAATFLAEPAAPAVDTEEREHEVVFKFGDRRWRVRGLDKNTSFERMKVNVLVNRDHPDVAGFHVDTLELYSARQRSGFVRDAALELGLEERVVKADLARVLLELERLQEEHIRRALTPQAQEVVLTDAERAAALSLLRDPRLVDRVVEDYARCGLVGEQDNVLLGYLVTVSRKLTEPLALVVQASSAAGKSALMETVLAFTPEEDRLSYSAMTAQALYYLGALDLRHKVLAISEQYGAESASYALKLLQSEGSLTIASTGRDPQTGRHLTSEYRVEGPVAVLMTTTSIEIDEELLNRCLVVTVDEGEGQTRAIHERQRRRETLEGVLEREERRGVAVLHQNAQRLLRPLLVVNPYAPGLQFGPSGVRSRRDFPKYLGLIRAIALLHQHQRQVRTVERDGVNVSYIEVAEGDIALADRLLGHMLRRDLGELPPQTGTLLGLVVEYVEARAETEGVEPCDVRFTRREVREATGWGNTALKVHMKRLQDLEMLHVHTGGAKRRIVYELDAYTYGEKWSGSGRGVVGGVTGPQLSNDRHDMRGVVASVGGTHAAGDDGAPYRRVTSDALVGTGDG